MGGVGTLTAENFSLLDVAPSETDKFDQNNIGDWDAGTAQFSLAFNYRIPHTWGGDAITFFPVVSSAISAYYISGHMNGEVQRFEDPSNIQERYNMGFSNTRVMFDLGVTLASWWHFSTYALAGVGIGWSEVDMDVDVNANPGCDCQLEPLDIETQSSTGLVYEFGAGLTYAFNDRVGVSAEYLFVVFDDVDIGGSDNQSSLNFGGTDVDISSQAVLLGLRVAF